MSSQLIPPMKPPLPTALYKSVQLWISRMDRLQVTLVPLLRQEQSKVVVGNVASCYIDLKHTCSA